MWSIHSTTNRYSIHSPHSHTSSSISMQFSWNMKTGDWEYVPKNNEEAACHYLKKSKLW